ncbi:MAG: Flavoprotein oxygenase DIM6/NTAB family-like protein 2 [Candidatus Tokpelaia hoelldobleri]|uniref:Flavoprotein oxygenase DIM6/NTAB family-like protein 2 n=1 Tax=Candidatus Tokpelaia hoelldobleri TaxID=1902579 RepID=A0A1U9JWX4_9HYPH|nr:MAG: Flavoprotein oxygenase DIM6/NTAB family-like protein 2 [Candidatus Tokpelaia hoelldoblerii]
MDYPVAETGRAVVSCLIKSLVIPRPIAWITSMSAQGCINAASFSFFNMMGDNPPVVAVGFSHRLLRNTAQNIMETGAFVINLVTEETAQVMNWTSLPVPADVNEMEMFGLQARASAHVAPPQIAQAPVSLECSLLETVNTGQEQILMVGRVIALRIEDALIQDAAKDYIKEDAFRPIARMGGSGTYSRTTDTFVMERPVLPQS